jgi:ABC-type amino acid transport system permease subunit
MLQLSLIYFASAGILGIKFTMPEAGIIAFVRNDSADMAELLRAGVDSGPRGQFKAAEALKIRTFEMWKDTILLQVLANILPALTNEIMAFPKETALKAMIGGADIMRKSQMFAPSNLHTLLSYTSLYFYTRFLRYPRNFWQKTGEKIGHTQHNKYFQVICRQYDPVRYQRGNCTRKHCWHDGLSDDGKSTFLHCIQGLKTVVSGQILCDSKIGLIF